VDESRLREEERATITDPWLDVGKMSDYEKASEEVASWGEI